MNKKYSIFIPAVLFVLLVASMTPFTEGKTDDSKKNPKKGKHIVLISLENVLTELLPGFDEIKEEKVILTDVQKKALRKKAKVRLKKGLDDEFTVYRGIKDGKINASVIKDSVKGKWGLITYMIKFNPEGKVMDIVILDYSEIRGKPVAQRKFLDQFIGKSTSDRIRLNRDIDGVSGATISSTSMTNGIRKLVHLYHTFLLIDVE